MTTKRHLLERDFYKLFANYLKAEDGLNECEEAFTLGGKCLGKKWGTPDVIGIYRPLDTDRIKFQPEIISAEIKINPSDSIKDFGQAIAYRLFSTTVYLVEPSSMTSEDLKEELWRIETLCIMFGIGLVLFDLDPQNPNFKIRVRAQSHNPSMHYVNQFVTKLCEAKKDVFDKLFPL